MHARLHTNGVTQHLSESAVTLMASARGAAYVIRLPGTVPEFACLDLTRAELQAGADLAAVMERPDPGHTVVIRGSEILDALLDAQRFCFDEDEG